MDRRRAAVAPRLQRPGMRSSLRGGSTNGAGLSIGAGFRQRQQRRGCPWGTKHNKQQALLVPMQGMHTPPAGGLQVALGFSAHQGSLPAGEMHYLDGPRVHLAASGHPPCAAKTRQPSPQQCMQRQGGRQMQQAGTRCMLASLAAAHTPCQPGGGALHAASQQAGTGCSARPGQHAVCGATRTL